MQAWAQPLWALVQLASGRAVLAGDTLLQAAHYANTAASLAVQASKQVMLQSLNEPDLQRAMQVEYALAKQMLASQDAIEGPLAFAQKRKPVWTGR